MISETGHKGEDKAFAGPESEGRRRGAVGPLRSVHPLRAALAAGAAAEGSHVQIQTQARPQPPLDGPKVSHQFLAKEN